MRGIVRYQGPFVSLWIIVKSDSCRLLGPVVRRIHQINMLNPKAHHGDDESEVDQETSPLTGFSVS